MAPTATRRLRAEKQEQFTNPDSWGPELNVGALDIIDAGWATTEVAVAANVTLTSINYLADQARGLVLILSGAGGFAVTAPAVDKPYLVINNCAADVTVKPTGGTAATIRAGVASWYYTNAAASIGYSIDPTLDKIKAPAASVAMNAQKLTGAAKGTAASDVATLQNEVQQFALPTANLPMNGQKITGLGTPTDAADAVTLGYLSALADSTALGIVAGIAPQVVTVAGISTQVVAVAANATNVNTVAVNIASVIIVANNIAAIIAAGVGIPSLARSARTSATQLTGTDKGTFIDITSGTFTQPFDAAATLTSGWWCYIRNSGTGDITLDPNSTELIDGLTSYIMYPGETRLIQCGGTAFTSLVLSPFAKVFTASGNFIKPPGYNQFGGMIRSAGASGDRRATTIATFGGPGGGSFPFVVPASAVAATQAFTIGAGGTANTVNSTTGSPGGTSSFLGMSVVGGGVIGATYGGSFITSGASATGATGFEASQTGTYPNPYAGGTSDAANPAGASANGGGAGGGISTANALVAAGASVTAGNGGAAVLAGAATAGVAPGGGGGASRNGFASGAGARGQLDIWGIA